MDKTDCLISSFLIMFSEWSSNYSHTECDRSWKTWFLFSFKLKNLKFTILTTSKLTALAFPKSSVNIIMCKNNSRVFISIGMHYEPFLQRCYVKLIMSLLFCCLSGVDKTQSAEKARKAGHMESRSQKVRQRINR